MRKGAEVGPEDDPEASCRPKPRPNRASPPAAAGQEIGLRTRSSPTTADMASRPARSQTLANGTAPPDAAACARGRADTASPREQTASAMPKPRSPFLCGRGKRNAQPKTKPPATAR